MTEETSNAITSVSVAATAICAVFFIARCQVAIDKTGEDRRMEAQKSEERQNIERIKSGYEYLPQGTWVKR